MSKSSELDQKAKRYILDQLSETPEGVPLPLYQDRIAHIEQRLMSEYGWRVVEAGKQQALTDWLQGLALPIAFNNVDILTLARDWGSLPANASEKQENEILENYWRFMTVKIWQLIVGYRVPTQEHKR